MKRIETTPDLLDDIKNNHDFDHFTIGLGRAKYHFITLANNSVGIYYAWRLFKDGSLGARRAMEPKTKIQCFVKSETN